MHNMIHTWSQWLVGRWASCRPTKAIGNGPSKSTSLLLQEIESRILLSASPIDMDEGASEPAEILLSGYDDSLELQAELFMQKLDEFSEYLQQQSDFDLQASSIITSQLPTSIVFIDDRLPDSQTLLNQFSFDSQSTLFVTIDSESDGISQISEYLGNANYQFETISIFSHGNSGQLQLGSTILNADNLEDFQETISSWQAGTSDNADFLIFGCQVASTSSGQSFLADLAAISGTDISASTDLTGSAGLGGDWDLEFQVGSIEATIILNPDPNGLWNHILDSTQLVAVKDTFINGAEPGTNYGTSTTLNVYDWDTGLGIHRTLLQFDLSAIPDGAEISSASLKLTTSSISGSIQLDVYRIQENWEEETGTNWTHRSGTETWSSAGGTVDANSYASITIGSSGVHSWDVTDLVKEWDDGVEENYGMMVAGPNSFGTVVGYQSRESSSGVPVLEVEYSLPNQAPAITNPSTVTVDEDTQTAIGGISFVDPDAGAGAIGARIIVNNGTLNFTLSGGASFLGGINNSDDITIYGNHIDLNAVLSTMQYTADENISGTGADTIQVLVDDFGNTGSGGSLNDFETISVNVNAINDDPYNSGSLISTFNAAEDTLTSLNLSAINLEDVDAGSSNLTVTISSSNGGNIYTTTPGDLAFTGAGSSTITITGTLTAINNHLNNTSTGLYYRHGTTNLNGNNVDTLTVVVNDNGNTGSGGGTDINLGSINVNIVAVNDVPTISGATIWASQEDVVTTITGVNVSDVDSGTSNLQVRLQATGNLQVVLSGAATIVAGTNGSNDLTILGSQADINATIDGIQYTPPSNQFGDAADTIVFTADDLGNSGSGGNLTATHQLQINLLGVNDQPLFSRVSENNFDNFSAGNLGTQGGWQVEKFNTSVEIQVASGGGVDGGSALTFSGVGSGVGNSASLVGATNIPNLTNAGSVDISFLLKNGTWGSQFALGYDADEDGAILRHSGEQALSVNIASNSALISASLPDGTSVSVAHGFAAGNWIEFRWELDLSSNGGSGVGTLWFRDVSSGQENWQTDALFTNVPLNLDPSANDKTNAGNWNGLYVHMEGDITGFDNLRVEVEPHSGVVSYVENGTPVVLDSHLRVFDSELNEIDDFGGSTLTLARNGGSNSQDTFSGTGNLVLSAGTIQLSSINVGSFTQVNGQLVLTFANGVSSTQIQEVAQSITYENTSDNPTAEIQIDWTFNDGNSGSQGGGGSLVAMASTIVHVTAVNDAPEITGLNGESIIILNDGVAQLIDTGVVATINDSKDGTVDFDGGSLTLSGLSFDLSDSLGIDTSGMISLSSSLTNGSIVRVGGVDIGILASVSNSSITIQFNAGANISNVNTLINGFTFETSSSIFGSRSIDIVMNDGDGVENGGSEVSLTSSVNVIVGFAGNGSITVNEDNTYTYSSTDFDFTGVTGVHLQKITITSLPADGRLQLNGVDVVINQEVTKAEIDSNQLTYLPDSNDNGAQYASFDFFVNSGRSTINVLAGEQSGYTLNGGSITPTDQLISNSSNFGTNGTYSAGISVIPYSSTIDATYLAQGDIFFDGWVPNVNYTAAEISAIDAWVNSGGVLISTNDSVGYDALSSAHGLVIGGTASSIWHISDSSHSIMNGPFGLVGNNGDVIQASGSISYFDSTSLNTGDITLAVDSVSGEPTMVLRQYGSGFLLFTSDEGIFRAGMTSDGTVSTANDRLVGNIFAWTANQAVPATTHQMDVNVLPVNDAPTFTVPGSEFTLQNTSVTFSTANGNLVSVNDIDAGSTHIQVTLSVTNGTLTLGSTTDLSFTGGDGTTDVNMVFTGTVNEINAALDGLIFTPANGFTGLGQISLIVDDLGNTGSGGPLTTTDTIDVNIGAIMVTNTSDAANGDTSSIQALIADDGGDGISLREAIIASNNTVGADSIGFNISGGGPHVIDIISALPVIQGTLIIDGTTEPDFSANGNRPVVVLDGGDGSFSGLVFEGSADNSSVKGLVIRDFGDNGIEIRVGADNLTVSGNYIGSFNIDGTGAGASENMGGAGIRILGSNATIGGTTAAERNLIAGINNAIEIYGTDATGNQISGNYIGVDITGNTKIVGAGDGINLSGGASNNTIGGTTSAHGNVIAGTSGESIDISGSDTSGNVIQYNLVGLGADGNTLMRSGGASILIVNGGDNMVIRDNYLAGSGYSGIEISGLSDGTTIQGNFIGTDATGTQDWGAHDHGVWIHGGATGSIIGGSGAGQGNVIAFNGNGSNEAGVFVSGSTSTGHTIRGNVIHSNTGIAIDLASGSANGVTANDSGDGDTGGNTLENTALITQIGVAGGGVIEFNLDTSSMIAGSYTIDFYATSTLDGGVAQPHRYLGSASAVAGGSSSATGSFSGAALNIGDYVIVTVTDADGNTSEHSAYVQAVVANQAPTASDQTITINEDTSRAISLSDLGYSDADSDPLSHITITSLETAGSLRLNGSDVTLNQQITLAELNAGELVFNPASNANGSGYAQFEFTVNDGTTDSVSANTIMIDVTAVNDAPTAHNTSINITEDSSYDIRVTTLGFMDVEGDDIDHVTIKTLPAAGTLRLNGVDVEIGDQITKAQLDARELTFAPAPNANGSGYANLAFQVHDGTEYSAADYTITFSVQATNDAPTASDNTITINEDTSRTISISDLGYNDVEGDPLNHITITTLETAGSLQLNGTDVTLNQQITLAQINAGELVFTPGLNQNGIGYSNFEFSVNDGNLDSVSPYRMTFDVSAINDAPTFTGGSSYSLNENLDTSGGHSLGILPVNDVDTGDVLTFSLIGGPDQSRFSINSSTGELIFDDGVLDFENRNSYQVTVRVTDSAGDFVNQVVTVGVVDENEAPTITLSNTRLSMQESIYAGSTHVADIQINDDALGTNNLILVGPDAAKFEIVGSSVYLRSGTTVDFETQTTLQFSVQVDDPVLGASHEDSATHSIAVTDYDEYDVSPVSDSNAAANSVNENATVGTTVGIIANAVDQDGSNNTVSYSLSDDAGGRFSINSTTGEVTVAGSLDFETAASHTIEVTASSSDGSTSVQTFNISVNDLDEFDVSAISDSNASANEVDENATVGTTVGLVAFASDQDGSNNTISYSLSDDAGGRFAVNSATGEVTVAGALDFETATGHTIEVTATSSDGSTSVRTFNISVNDVDEFDVSAITDTDGNTNAVNENATVGSTVGLVAMASDADGSNNTVSYSLSDDAGGRFAINSATGEVTVAGALDYETASNHTIEVTATSSDGSTSVQTFNISVNDLDEFDISAITDSDASANAVDENAEIGNTVGVIASANDADGTNNTITYSLSDNAGGRFAINSTTGEVTVAGALNFESATGHTIEVTATSSDGSSSVQTFNISVLDQDEYDISPITDTDGVSNQVNENASVGTTVGVVAHASDADGSGNTVTYSLSDDSGGRFAINSSTGQVTVSGAIDFETATIHTIEVTATSSDGSTSVEEFTIVVNDLDEFDVSVPVDSDPSVNAVDENASAGTSVGLVAFANDPDGANNNVTYSLTDDAGGRFSINSSTGEVTVAGSLDFEIATSHTVEVTATSSDGSSSEQTFTIEINDVDEFDVSPITNIASGHPIAEDSSIGSFASVYAQATDADGSNNTVSYSLTDDAGGLFQINSATGVVTVAASLDYETAISHTIEVTATGSDGSASTQTFTINIADRDEHDVSAITDSNAALNIVNENASIGASVGLTAFASDADGTNNAITYSLSDDASGRFTIDSVTGEVQVASGLDYESATSHTIEVTATSSDGSVSTETFTIAVNDQDEFDVSLISDTDTNVNSVSESSSVGTSVGITAFASDSDGTNNTITYSLSDDAAGRFAINGSTGEVTVASALDYESSTSHTIEVTATSADGSSTSRTFSISVTDEDEFDVSAISDSNAATNQVNENASVGTSVGLVAFASDGDGTDNTVTYSLNDDAGGRFAINSSTGEVTVASGLDYESFSSHSISVTASGSDGSSSVRSFSIAILDIDEFDISPVTDSDPGTNTVSESAAIGTSVGVTALATDADGTTNDVTYSLSNSAGGLFAINSSTGEVTVASTLNYELATSHTIEVTATSADGSFATETFHIAVTDEDEFDVTAITDINAAANQIEEDAVVGSSVGIVAFASDADGTNNTVTYSLTDDAGGRFAINSTTGEVTVASGLDYEVTVSHNIEVAALSSDGSSSVRTFAIAVGDIDEFDISPISDSEASLNSVSESASVGTTVGVTAFASDADGSNNQITYSLSDDAGGRFAINSATGQVTVGSGLDFESAVSHSIVVTATSADGSVSTRTFSIAVTDEDEFDVSPIADTDPSVNFADEDASVGTSVGLVAFASDEDGSNNTVTYSLSDNAGGIFAINASTGEVTVASGLDYETSTSHTIEVTATSSDGSSSVRTFSISVGDVDEFDVSPIADTDIAIDTVSESASVGTTVGITAFASDADGTSNVVSYTLSDDAGGRFAINSTTGVVTVASGLDYESNTTHTIEVTATSQDGSVSTRSFSIAVTDEDEFDVSPISDSNAGADQIQENAAVGTSVGIVANAVDADGTNNTVSYSLSDNAGGRFSIDSVTGEVTVAGAIDFEQASSHSIEVTASSSDGSVSTRTFTIGVIDQNDAPTDIQLSSNQVQENSSAGTVVGSFSSVDQDSADSHTYQIISGNDGTFGIDGSGNLIVAQENLNFESQATYNLVVRSFDSAGATVDRTFQIDVLDRNDRPVGEDSTFSLPEDTSTIGTVITAGTTDEDGDGIQVSLVNGPANADSFQLQNDGSFSYSPSADYNGTDSFTFRLYDGQDHSDVRTVTLNVTGVNDTPIGQSDQYELDQGAALSTGIHSVLDNDSDIDNDPLIAQLVTSPAHGTITFSPDGTFIYQPDPTYFGSDLFSYVVNDGTIDGNTVQVQLEINAVDYSQNSNDPVENTAEDDGTSSDPGQEDGDEGSKELDEGGTGDLQTGSLEEPTVGNAGENLSGESGNPEGLFGPIQKGGTGAGSVFEDRVQLFSDEDASKREGLERSGLAAARVLASKLHSPDLASRDLGFQQADIILQNQTITTWFFDSSKVWQDSTSQSADSDQVVQLKERLIDGSILTGSLMATAGYLLWTLRGGILMATFLSSMPNWRFIDPLPVIDSLDGNEGEPNGEIGLQEMLGGDLSSE